MIDLSQNLSKQTRWNIVRTERAFERRGGQEFLQPKIDLSKCGGKPSPNPLSLYIYIHTHAYTKNYIYIISTRITWLDTITLPTLCTRLFYPESGTQKYSFLYLYSRSNIDLTKQDILRNKTTYQECCRPQGWEYLQRSTIHHGHI